MILLQLTVFYNMLHIRTSELYHQFPINIVDKIDICWHSIQKININEKRFITDNNSNVNLN